MSASQLWQYGIRELSTLIASRQVSVKEVAGAFLERIEATEERLHAFLYHAPEQVLKQAAALDERLSREGHPPSPLFGIPLAIKDVISTRGMPTTCGSRMLANYIPPYDATVVERLRQAGALLLGKTNCDEFAMGSSTENSAFGPTRNPWDLNRVPGGSSGGSAACVAARQAPAALGTDTGGSIRQPAAFCGIVGLKPTYGRVSRYGLVAFASSLDQIGPMTLCVEDAACLLQAIAGPDGRDSTCSRRGASGELGEKPPRPEKVRVGVTRQGQQGGLDEEIETALQKVLQLLQEAGCRVEEVDLPHGRYAIATYYLLAPAEASSNLSRYDGVKFGYRSPDGEDLESMYRRTRSQGFGAEVKRRIMLGTFALSAGYYDAYYLRASKVRTLIRRDFQEAFQRVDFLIGPTTPTPAFRLGEKTADPLQMYLSDVFTVPANLAGLPAISLPCGFSARGLPLGVQVLAPHFQEGKLLSFARLLEELLSLPRHIPLS